MRLATWNLLNGISLTDGRSVASRLAEGARTLAPDVLGLQEVDRGQARTAHRDLTAEVAEALGFEHARFEAAIIGTPGGTWRPAQVPGPPGPEYGIGLVSRWPVRSWHVLRLPAAPVRSPVLIPATRQLVLLRDEPRVALAAVVQAPGGDVTVCTTHLSFTPGWNLVQLRRTTRWLRTLPGPHVLLGDLNMPPPFPRVLTGWQQLARVRTFPSPEPRVQLDHVLGSDGLPPVRSVEAPLLPVSDHRALLVEL